MVVQSFIDEGIDGEIKVKFISLCGKCLKNYLFSNYEIFNSILCNTLSLSNTITRVVTNNQIKIIKSNEIALRC